MEFKKIYFQNIIILLVVISFFLGFYFLENSAGGGEGDYDHILNNYNLIFNTSFENIDWSKYRDSRFPLDYFIFKIYLPNNEFFWRLNIFILSLVTPLILYFTLQLKNELDYNSSLSSIYLIFISLFLFISPYFRTSSYWMLRENIGYFFWIIAIYFFLKTELGFKYKLYSFLTIFFSYLSFYSSQNLFIIPLVNFFLLLNFNKILSKKNLFIITINIFFFSPLILFFDFFNNAMQYIEIEEINRITFSIYKIVDLYSIILIYIIPIFLIYFKPKQIVQIFKKNYFKILIFLAVYICLFWNYPNQDPLSGGAIRKLLNIVISNQFLFKIAYLSLSGASFIIVFYLSYIYERRLLFLLVPYTLFYTFINYIFQEYLDPIFFLFVILYSSKFLKLLNKKELYLFSYFFLFYLSSFFYYNL